MKTVELLIASTLGMVLLVSCDWEASTSDASLKDAARYGNTNTLAVYLEKKGDLNRLLQLREKPPVRQSMLHVAVENGQPATVRWLLDHGADVNVTNWEGRTPLMSSVFVRVDEVPESVMLQSFRDLIKHSAKIVLKDYEGNDVLTYACRYSQYSMAKELLEKGADANSTNVYGLSPLHWAPDRQTAELLVKYGANPWHRNRYGESPVDWAVKNRRWDVLDVLTNQPSSAPKQFGP